MSQRFVVVADKHSNHNLPIGAEVTACEGPVWTDSTGWYTQGGTDDEVAIDPRDLIPVKGG